MRLNILLIISFLFLSINLFANIAVLNKYSVSNRTYQNYYQGNSDNGGVFNIYSSGELNLFNVNFISNTAYYAGGAIYNNYGKLTIEDCVFKNNNANGGGLINAGGAIYNKGGIINLIAKTSNVEFSGNTAGVSNAITDINGTINLWAGNASVIFNDSISSDNSSSILNINQSSGTLPTTGKIVLNEDMSGYKGTVNLYGGTIQLGRKAKWFGSNVNINANSAAINMANGVIQRHNFNSLSINNDLNLSVDADLKNKVMDTISANSYSGNGKIYIKAINILQDATAEKTNISFTNSYVLRSRIISSVTEINSKLYNYSIVYDQATGNLIFNANNFSKINPIINESAIATSVGGFTLQSMLVEQVFSNLGSNLYCSNQVEDEDFLYSSDENQIFEENKSIEKMLWLRPFTLQEAIKLNNFNIDNSLTGTLAGIDFPVGQDKQVSFYLGYAGSQQKYENITISQTGFVLGLSGKLIKNSWYLGLTANKVFNGAESKTVYGNDSFDVSMYSIGAKTGFDCKINEKWTLEPNITLMYGIASNQQYRTKQGANINSQSYSNILFEPQIKAKLGLSNGWQPYGLVGYAANLSGKPTVKADGTELELDKTENFVELGLGINKNFINSSWSLSLQIMKRNGFSGNICITYKLNSTLEKIKAKKEEKQSLEDLEKRLKRVLEQEEKELEEMEEEND